VGPLSYAIAKSGLITGLLVSNFNWFIIGPTVKFIVSFLYLPLLTSVLGGPGDRPCRLVKVTFVVHRSLLTYKPVSAIGMLCSRICIEHTFDHSIGLT
jgi:hypothetical protein